MTRTVRLLLLTAGIFIPALSCAREQPKEAMKKPHSELSALQDAILLGDIQAMATGGAYLASPSGEVFYISGALAERVQGIPNGTTGEVLPLADGSALLVDSVGDPPTIFLLQGTHATRVLVGSIPVAIQECRPAPEGFLFAEVQRLKKALREERTKNEPLTQTEE